LTQLAYPAISCGVYGCPHERAARIAVQTVRAFSELEQNAIQVTLFAFDVRMAELLQAAVAAD
jgi:O-acetyl-ADP-ribose deacetylase (regulator of RNase III)